MSRNVERVLFTPDECLFHGRKRWGRTLGGAVSGGDIRALRFRSAYPLSITAQTGWVEEGL